MTGLPSQSNDRTHQQIVENFLEIVEQLELARATEKEQLELVEHVELVERSWSSSWSKLELVERSWSLLCSQEGAAGAC